MEKLEKTKERIDIIKEQLTENEKLLLKHALKEEHATDEQIKDILKQRE